MTRINLTLPSVTESGASTLDLQPARRLIVLVSPETDFTGLAGRIWELANALESRVQFLGLCSDAAQEASIRRQLTTLSAMLEGDRVRAEAWLVLGKNWVTALKPDLQEGDTIVCFADQRAGFFRKPLSQILESNLRTPVYVLADSSEGPRAPLSWLSKIIVWAGSLVIIAGSTLVQIQITSVPRAGAQTTLMILSVMIEAWLIWTWNGLFG